MVAIKKVAVVVVGMGLFFLAMSAGEVFAESDYFPGEKISVLSRTYIVSGTMGVIDNLEKAQKAQFSNNDYLKEVIQKKYDYIGRHALEIVKEVDSFDEALYWSAFFLKNSDKMSSDIVSKSPEIVSFWKLAVEREVQRHEVWGVQSQLLEPLRKKVVDLMKFGSDKEWVERTLLKIDNLVRNTNKIAMN
jgi:hypothetical protein